jgi:hypothetical protein
MHHARAVTGRGRRPCALTARARAKRKMAPAGRATGRLGATGVRLNGDSSACDHRGCLVGGSRPAPMKGDACGDNETSTHP